MHWPHISRPNSIVLLKLNRRYPLRRECQEGGQKNGNLKLEGIAREDYLYFIIPWGPKAYWYWWPCESDSPLIQWLWALISNYRLNCGSVTIWLPFINLMRQSPYAAPNCCGSSSRSSAESISITRPTSAVFLSNSLADAYSILCSELEVGGR